MKATKRGHFPGYPHLAAEAQTANGWAVLREVNRTSDGYLIGWADFYADSMRDEHLGAHSIFLGAAR